MVILNGKEHEQEKPEESQSETTDPVVQPVPEGV